MLTISSGYNLLVISIERYQAITNPLAYDEQRLKDKLYIIIPVIWISGIILAFPDPFLFQVKDGICSYVPGQWSMRDSLLLFSYFAVTNFLIPGMTMVILYTKMGLVIRESRKTQSQMVSKSGQKKSTLSKAQTNIFYTCVILLFFYFTCWLSNIVSIMLFLARFIDFSTTVVNISAILVLVNSVINPFIYAIRYDEYKLHLRMLFCGYKPDVKQMTSKRSLRGDVRGETRAVSDSI